MLTVHHLGRSQSERIVWLCEELGVPYELKRYERDSVTILAHLSTRRSIRSEPRL
jgi:glutathione S-transferase